MILVTGDFALNSEGGFIDVFIIGGHYATSILNAHLDQLGSERGVVDFSGPRRYGQSVMSDVAEDARYGPRRQRRRWRATFSGRRSCPCGSSRLPLLTLSGAG